MMRRSLPLKGLLVGLGALMLLVQCQPAAPLGHKQQALPAKPSLGGPGHFLVTPRWSPDGKKILAAGHYGVGLYLLDAATAEITPFLPSFSGRAQWHDDGHVDLALFPGTQGTTAATLHHRLSLASGNIQTVPTPNDQWTSPKDKLLYQILWDRQGRKITYQWFHQRLQIEERGTILYKRDGVWGVKVSPDGSRVAFSEGLLARGKLFVHDSSGVHALGPGIHPTWSPRGGWLVYSRPVASDTKTDATDLRKDQLKLIGADLYAVQLPQMRYIPLTNTPQRLELEPAISPDGSRIACADWSRGTILILPFGWGGP